MGQIPNVTKINLRLSIFDIATVIFLQKPNIYFGLMLTVGRTQIRKRMSLLLNDSEIKDDNIYRETKSLPLIHMLLQTGLFGRCNAFKSYVM